MKPDEEHMTPYEQLRHAMAKVVIWGYHVEFALEPVLIPYARIQLAYYQHMVARWQSRCFEKGAELCA